ncbi:class D sortase [Kroppenstedtia eburnea]|uniref:Sortase A n=1 Tax=Kroppenstedtia eburnea TaxID=714067 RepID=A0A1N7LEY0_9BACL|nr:class D sortase [Kroppenstedtia eburnea]EGK07785.1 LPXTG-site transpeptidase [Desmospora sp. 8437]QKI81379.1 class D sortase [Kroppenstedtia eburnea]SIS72346.1 sortase A [Kroppenstedtia eburnea]
MARGIAIILIVVGLSLVAYNGYQWWDQIRVVVQDPKLAMSIADDWDNLDKEPSKKKGTDADFKPKKGDQIGQLFIPRIGAVLPIIYGTGNEELAKGVGQYIGYGTVLPGETGHSVLAGHRETTFRRAGELKEGDKIYVKMDHHTYTYQIRKMFIVDEHDRSVIVPHDQPDMSLITCYPFNLVGSAPQRYIIRADLIDSKENE